MEKRRWKVPQRWSPRAAGRGRRTGQGTPPGEAPRRDREGSGRGHTNPCAVYTVHVCAKQTEPAVTSGAFRCQVAPPARPQPSSTDPVRFAHVRCSPYKSSWALVGVFDARHIPPLAITSSTCTPSRTVIIPDPHCLRSHRVTGTQLYPTRTPESTVMQCLPEPRSPLPSPLNASQLNS